MAYFGIIFLFSGLDVVYNEWHKLSSQACFEITMLSKILILLENFLAWFSFSFSISLIEKIQFI